MHVAILDDENNVVVTNDLDLAVSFFNSPRRIVKQDIIGGVQVSTVFLVFNHGTEDNPLWFETMVFDRDECKAERSVTWDEALETHNRTVERLSKI